jgi:hypothetical protein
LPAGSAGSCLATTPIEQIAAPFGVRRISDHRTMPLTALRSHAREVADIARAATPTHRRFREHLVTITIVTITIDMISAVAAFALERDAPQTEIKTLADAAFWTTTQLLTVSSSLKNPISAGGRILDVVMEVYAITVVAALAGAFGSFLQRRGVDRERQRSAAAS